MDKKDSYTSGSGLIVNFKITKLAEELRLRNNNAKKVIEVL